jgi:inosine-uridine nucleoside N-ribohydrolase
MSAARTRLIIDCDPGHDDMAAILLAAWHPDISLEAITSACGNASIENTTNNALRIVEAFDLGVPVYRGTQLPLFHRYEYPAAFHGPSGLDSAGVELPSTTRTVEPNGAVAEIIRRVEESPGEISIAIIGPMTNVALALAMKPELATKIREIVFMGGSHGEGNVTPAAEFNIWADAEAANIVFRAGVKLVMFGLNVTHQALLRRDDMASVRAAVPGANPVADIMDFYCNTYYAFAGADKPGAPLHDPCAIAYLIDPAIFTTEDHPGEVVISQGPAYGMTLIDVRPQDPLADTRVRNVRVALGADQAGFSALINPALIWGAERLARR